MTTSSSSGPDENDAAPLHRALAANLTGAAVFVVNADLRYVLADGPVLREIGKSPPDFEGKKVSEALSPAQACVAEAHYRQALAGQPFQHQHHQDGRDYATFGTPLRNRAGEVYAVMAVSYDITERKRREANQELLFVITDDLSRFSDEAKIFHCAGAHLARHLNLTCYHYVDVDEARAEVTVRHFWHALDIPAIHGTYPISEFVPPHRLIGQRAGEASIINDVQNDLPGDSDAMVALKAGAAAQKIASYVAVPYSQDGIWKAYFAVADSRPRQWTPLEIELIQEVAARVFPRIERARAEATLQALNEQLELRVLDRTEALRQSHTQLRELSTHMETTREDERTRIAREVHDELGGHLTALKIEVGSLAWGRDGDEALTMRVNELKTHIDEIVQIVRRIGSDLRPPVLDDYGLIPALEWHGREWARRTGIACQLDLVEDKPPLSREKRTAVFRAFQEALTNVARHAHATAVNVAMAIHNGELMLVIEDNGIGIPPEALAFSRSLGLKGMQERLKEVGGLAEVEGQPGQGTVVAIRVPV